MTTKPLSDLQLASYGSPLHRPVIGWVLGLPLAGNGGIFVPPIILTVGELAVSNSTDPLYAVLATAAITMTNQDNDVSPIYLSLIVRNFVSAPDLVIDSLSSDANGPLVVIRNTGNAAMTDTFWVDVYYNPTRTPGLNNPWPMIAPAGAVWGVTKSLTAGESLTLTVGDPYYFPQYSNAGFPIGTQVYG